MLSSFWLGCSCLCRDSDRVDAIVTLRRSEGGNSLPWLTKTFLNIVLIVAQFVAAPGSSVSFRLTTLKKFA